MICKRRIRLRAVMLAALVAAGAGLCSRADVVSNCFKVVNYSVCWHVECTLDGFTNALDIAIDDNANNGFRVGDHGSRQYTNLAAVESGETIDAGTFIRLSGMVEFANQSDFIVAFAIGCSEINRIDGNFGWVRLAYEGGTIVLKGGAINTIQGSPLVVEGELPSVVDPVTGCETNTFYMTRESPPRILHLRDVAFDFVVFNYEDHRWGVGVQHSSGHGYVATVPAETSVGDSTFPQQNDYDSYEGGDLFFLAFKWWPNPNDTSRRTRYGWLAIGLKDGAPAVLASEMSETAGAPLVGRGFEQGDDSGGGDDEEADDLLFDWVVIDRGEYIELGEQNQPTNGTSGKVIIPSEIGGKPVCSIGEGAFYSHEEITQVIIPETISNIGYKAFNCCLSLERCNIPSGVTNIDEMAFNNTALLEITLPDGLGEIKNWTFGHCGSLSNVVLGAGVTNIGEMAFCPSALTNVTIGTQVEYIDFAAFQGCNMKSVNVWPWTRLGVQPFDLSCRIGYTGTITNFTDFAWECGEDVTNMMAWVGRENFSGVTEFRVYDEYGPLWGYEYGTSKLLYYAGLAPGEPQKRGNVLEMKYTKPKIEIVSFNVATRKLTGKVVPQGGGRIAQLPGDAWILGIWHYDQLSSEGHRDSDAVPDLASYLETDTLGEFTHTISEEDFATNRFFKLVLDN